MRYRLLSPGESLIGAAALARAGLVRPYRPDRLLSVGLRLARYGLGPGMGVTLGAACYPDAPALIDADATGDEGGVSSMRQLDASCTAVARGLAAAGLSAADRIGLLARNSAAFYQVVVGASRLGADVVYLNPGFPAGQVADLVERYGIGTLVYDAEFADRVPAGIRRIPTTDDTGTGTGTGTGTMSVPVLARLSAASLAAPARPSRHLILTSGTTGTPKGVARTGGGPSSVVSLLSGLPLRVRQTHLVAAPLFHAWGWLHMLLGMLLSSTIVVARRFDPERTLALVERHRCHVLVAVPTMLQKIMDLPADVRRRYDPSSLRVVAVSGSALSGRLATTFMDEYGEILYSLYGSTEAGFAAVATPADLRAAPGTAGRALPAVSVGVVDGSGRPCPAGVAGSIVVRSRDAVAADVAGAETVRTGDLGWLDPAGRLFVGGRADDMIIVNGENVYPTPVEHALERHPAVAEAAVVGVPDRVLGQALVAHVALRTGATANPEGIRAWCRSELAPFQVPRRVVIYAELPHNETGKVLKSALVAA